MLWQSVPLQHCHLAAMLKQRDRGGSKRSFKRDIFPSTRLFNWLAPPASTIQERGSGIFRRLSRKTGFFGNKCLGEWRIGKLEYFLCKVYKKLLSRFTTSRTWIKYCFCYWPTLVSCDDNKYESEMILTIRISEWLLANLQKSQR